MKYEYVVKPFIKYEYEYEYPILLQHSSVEFRYVRMIQSNSVR